MRHRHLTHQNYTLAAIDDVIFSWSLAGLGRSALCCARDRALLEKVQRICHGHVQDPYAQRYHFWMHYAEEHLPSA